MAKVSFSQFRFLMRLKIAWFVILGRTITFESETAQLAATLVTNWCEEHGLIDCAHRPVSNEASDQEKT